MIWKLIKSNILSINYVIKWENKFLGEIKIFLPKKVISYNKSIKNPLRNKINSLKKRIEKMMIKYTCISINNALVNTFSFISVFNIFQKIFSLIILDLKLYGKYFFLNLFNSFISIKFYKAIIIAWNLCWYYYYIPKIKLRIKCIFYKIYCKKKENWKRI